MKILFFAGSTRSGSLNKQYVALAHKILSRNNDLECELLQLNDYALPVYDGDIEKNSFPPAAKALAEKIQACSAMVISSPENNGSIAAVLKNTIDWVSRLPNTPWKGKHILLMGASPGAFGAVRGLWHTRVPFEALGCYVYPEMSGLPKAHEAFAVEGELKDKASQERLTLLLDAFKNHASD